MMLGCMSLASAWASRRKRSTYLGSRWVSTLMATKRSSAGSVARYSAPMPPEPSITGSVKRPKSVRAWVSEAGIALVLHLSSLPAKAVGERPERARQKGRITQRDHGPEDRMGEPVHLRPGAVGLQGQKCEAHHEIRQRQRCEGRRQPGRRAGQRDERHHPKPVLRREDLVGGEEDTDQAAGGGERVEPPRAQLDSRQRRCRAQRRRGGDEIR